MNIEKKEDFASFRCLRCGACCKWEGPVRITDAEADAIAEYLGLPIHDFLRDYTCLAPDRRSLSLLEKEDGSCFYYDEENRSCRIQDVKPRQCRDFPRVWNFPGWRTLCAGGHTDIMTEEEKEPGHGPDTSG